MADGEEYPAGDLAGLEADLKKAGEDLDADEMALQQDREGYAAYTRKRMIDGTALGRLIQRERQIYWASHPLLQRFFSDVPMPESVSPSNRSNFFDTYPDSYSEAVGQ